MTYRPFTVIISQATSSSTTNKSTLKNNSGLTINALAPVRIDVNGDIDTIDVSVESEALTAIGITESSILNGSSGPVVTTGKIENIVTSFGFGDYIYVSKTGELTNVGPSEGIGGFVAGDFIIRVGVIAKNQSNPLNKDLLVNFNIVGQI